MFTSPATTYSDTTPHKRVITDVISIISPSDAPAIMALGGLDGASGKFRFVNEPGKVVEWLEDTLISLSGDLNGSITSNATTITMTTADNVQEGHIILVDAEYMWVSSVDNATEIVTVTRNYQGTQATHADADVVSIVGMARLEGDESDDIAFTDRTVGSNFTQILHQEVKVTRTQRQIAQYGISDEMIYQQNKAVKSLMRLLELHFYNNSAAIAGSATTARVMGGYQAFVTDNLVSGSTLAQSQFENAVKAAYEDGGDGPFIAFLSPDNLQKVKNFYDSSNYLRVDRTEATVGMVIERILTPYGSVDLLLDRWARDAQIAILDPGHVGFKTLYPFTGEPLAKGGDYDKWEVVGEFTLCLRQDKAHAMLTNVS
jgi:hypothetical protein